MAVHWNPAIRYTPKNDAEKQLIEDVHRRRHFDRDTTRLKCGKCKKHIRGAGHDCKNGK